MKRQVHWRIPILALLGLALLAGRALANPSGPDPDHCSVMPPDGMASPRLVGVPAGGSGEAPVADLEIVIRGWYGTPIGNAWVEVSLAGSCNDPDPLCLCEGVVFTGTTDDEGYVRIRMRYGGCCRDASSAIIYANDFPIRGYDILMSPDYDGEHGDCRVNLADFVYFSGGYAQAGEPCRNYDGDGAEACTLPDFVAFAGMYAKSCSGS